MFHFEKSLPRLPLPKLEDSCGRYLTALKPLVNSEQWTATRSIVESFRDGAGKNLHERLVAKDKANKHTSYISGTYIVSLASSTNSVVCSTHCGRQVKISSRCGQKFL